MEETEATDPADSAEEFTESEASETTFSMEEEETERTEEAEPVEDSEEAEPVEDSKEADVETRAKCDDGSLFRMNGSARRWSETVGEDNEDVVSESSNT